MWFSEVHRIGFKKCTPLGYTLNGLGSLLFFAIPLSILVIQFLDALRSPVMSHGWSLLLWLGLAIAGVLAKGTANTLAENKSFDYQYKPDEATWNHGKYTNADWKRDYPRKLPERK